MAMCCLLFLLFVLLLNLSLPTCLNARKARAWTHVEVSALWGKWLKDLHCAVST